ncbi:MAG TPA: glutamate 5-kinase [Solirubrobacterales bacterium]|jgi:glutamate 5-kinase|nr:glutamate 5-kinase [Solirubrobacterales bacterium]
MTLVVKLGSSIVAADDGELRVDVLDSVCEQVSALERGGERVVMVTSGAIARGMRLMELPVRPRAMDELQAASAVGQGDLFRAYESRLAKGGSRAAQVLLTAADIAARTNYLNARQTLRRLVEWGVVPVINENDTTATDEISFGDNDFLAAQVAILLDARLLVLLTNVDGLYSQDPSIVDPSAGSGAFLISAVERFSDLAEFKVGDRTSAFGSGGMRSKVAAAEMASESGIPAVICNGTEPGTLAAAAAGDAIGTRFAAQPGKASSFKLWLKYAKPAKGRVLVDDGAARVLREHGSSLLPVGIIAIEGDFNAGDAVDVAADGAVIGKGICDYSSQELDQVKGMKTEQVGELLPHAADEVIHRDRFVLL